MQAARNQGDKFEITAFRTDGVSFCFSKRLDFYLWFSVFLKALQKERPYKNVTYFMNKWDTEKNAFVK